MSILHDDARYIWHPFTQHGFLDEKSFLPVMSAQGSYLFDDRGRKYLDLIASWWVITHGHCHVELVKALTDQAAVLDQVIFAGTTHQPAVNLARALQGALGRRDVWKLFFSDNGSTSVEVALKMALQAQENWGFSEKKSFIAFEGAYHGDTVGAMSVGQGSGFFAPYRSLMFPIHTFPYPQTWWDDQDVDVKEKTSLQALDVLLNTGTIAGLIVEPLIQGASGMRMCRPDFLTQVVRRAQEAGVIVIFDEVMTGFGRTGSLFAFHQIPVTPDIVCLAKGLTGGMMPMSLTCARQEIFDAFLSPDFYKSLIHGHSFTANPLACAVAVRSLQLFDTEKTLEKIAALHQVHHVGVRDLLDQGLIVRPRILGSVAAFDMTRHQGVYGDSVSLSLRQTFLDHGLLLRPLGGTLYIMPPYSTSLGDLSAAYQTIGRVLKQVEAL